MKSQRIAPSQLRDAIGVNVGLIVERIGSEVENRSQYRVANELRNKVLEVMRGPRSGKPYRVPSTGKFYIASAPGEAPAWRTGGLAKSFAAITSPKTTRSGANRTIRAGIESKYSSGQYLIGKLLEDGTKKMARRPYKGEVITKAMPGIIRILKEPYGRS
jgi:hypothetical protein